MEISHCEFLLQRITRSRTFDHELTRMTNQLMCTKGNFCSSLVLCLISKCTISCNAVLVLISCPIFFFCSTEKIYFPPSHLNENAGKRNIALVPTRRSKKSSTKTLSRANRKRFQLPELSQIAVSLLSSSPSPNGIESWYKEFFFGKKTILHD